MKNGHDPREQIAIPKGATQVDLRLTKHPVDTPRGRLHRMAATSIRAIDTIRRSVELDRDGLDKLRQFARRGLDVVGNPTTYGERTIAMLCGGLDQVIFVLTVMDVDTVAKLCEGLQLTLIQLEAAENKVRELENDLEIARRDVKSARGDVQQLRTLLAKLHARTAKKEAAEHEANQFKDEKTCRRDITAEQKALLDDPNIEERIDDLDTELDVDRWVVDVDAQANAP